VDGLGNVYMAGWTQGELGGPNTGLDGYDIFIAKFDAGDVSVPEPSAAVLLGAIFSGLSIFDPRRHATKSSAMPM
jgi:hypothetical protein